MPVTCLSHAYCSYEYRWTNWCDLQPVSADWYQVCKECYQCETSLIRELNRISVANHSAHLVDEQQLRPFSKLPHRADLIHIMLTDILDKPLRLVILKHLHKIATQSKEYSLIPHL